jgi:hypothetical protein
MRLWSLHPRYLDPQGLVALWREALLAQAVLRGETRGYRHHPQLERFRSSSDPLAAISLYLKAVHVEATARGYNFDKAKIKPNRATLELPVGEGQLQFEWEHLLAKLKSRNPALFQKWRGTAPLETHPLFVQHPGGIADWERPS